MPVGGEVLADLLAGYGVTHIFQVPAVLRRTMAELERRTDVKRIRPHGEKSAAYMADGYARASGRPGICMAQVVGAQNLAAGLRDAYLAHSPVLAFTGGRDPGTKFRKVYQEVDDLPSFETVTKFNATVDIADRIPDLVAQAFRVAVSGSPGPVHLQFAGNEGQVDQQETDVAPTIDARFSRVPPFRPQPAEEDIRAVLERIGRAKRPIIVSGGGVAASRASGELVRLAERLSIPVATSLNGKDTIPASHRLAVGVVGTYSRASANRAVAESDLVVFVGSETGGMTTHFWRVPPIGTPVIQIDIDPEAIGRNYRAEVAVQADARATLSRLADASDPVERPEWCRRTGQLVGEWRAEHDPALGSDAVPIRPERICRELSRLVPDDGIVVVDTGHSGMWMGGMYDLRTPAQSYLRSAGHLGWAFPASLGAKCAQPDRPVVCFTGDSGFWYHVAELETAVRWNIRSVTVVNNNRSGNQSKPGFDRAYGGEQTERGARELWQFTDVDFAGLARAIGAEGIRVERPADIAPGIERALAADGPVVVDIVSDIEAMAPLAVVGERNPG